MHNKTATAPKIDAHCSHGHMRNFGTLLFVDGSTIIGKGSFAQQLGLGELI
jgi:hypothetical protein